jgi:hypothetical protein
MKQYFKHMSLFLLVLFFEQSKAYSPRCGERTFISNSSFNTTSFTVLTFLQGTEVLDSLHWNFGDGTTAINLNPGSGTATHNYATSGTHIVTLEQWGHDIATPANIFHCIYSSNIITYDVPLDSMCEGNFGMMYNGNVVTFVHESQIHSNGFLAYPNQPLWDFGNGTSAPFLNKIYEVQYSPGIYNACLYYMGFSLFGLGYTFLCKTCKKVEIFPTDVSNHQTINFSISPNPVSNELLLKSNEKLSDYRFAICNTIGQSIKAISFKKTNDEIKFNVSDLPSGIYYLKINTSKYSKSLSFVINK